MHGHQVTIENAGVFHRHADHLEQVMWLGLEDAGIDVEPGFDILFGENGTACGNTTDERQTHLLAHGVHELDAARSAGHERDDALARQGAQMFFGGVRGFETELVGDFRPRGRHAGFVNVRAG